MINNLAYYISKETNPYVNLAIENYLLNIADLDTLILYLWQNKNTVVIGKNQNPWAECRCALLEQDGGLLARRTSGGGAVFHDLGNLNFTFLSTQENSDVERHMKIIQKACAMEGITAEVSGRNDITADGKKFSGNAFYNSKGKSYHHGTLLINADKERMLKYLTPPQAKLVTKGVKSVSARVVNLSELSKTVTCESIMQNLLKAFAEAFKLTPSFINDIDMSFINAKAKEYSDWDYIYGKTIDFSISLKNHFDWGNLELLLQVEEGNITKVKTYTDAMDHNLSESIENALLGSKYDLNVISNRLAKTFSENLYTDIISLFQTQGF